MSSRLRLWEIEVPFRRPLQTSAGSLLSRHSVIVALDDHGVTGWAEAPGFPSGRFGSAAEAFDDLADPDGWEGGKPSVPIARAALEGARADARARAEGKPLHELLGASGAPVPARHPVGLLRLDQVTQRVEMSDPALEAEMIVLVRDAEDPGAVRAGDAGDPLAISSRGLL